MDDFGQSISKLQAIQDEIITFIQINTQNGLDDPLAIKLRRAIGELNDAKGLIWDQAVEKGVFNPIHAGSDLE